MNEKENILILTPVKNAAPFLDRYFELLCRLSWPRRQLSIAFLESDSADDTYQRLENEMPRLRQAFRAAHLFQRSWGFRIPPDQPRWAPEIQLRRREIIARGRNYLLARALDDEDRVLWLDVDLVDYPPDVIEKLLATGKDIVQPHCVNHETGKTFDLNAWRDNGKRHMDDLRGEGELVRLHAVGGTMLLVRADLHREGLVFPPFLYGRRHPLIRDNNQMVRYRELGKLWRGEHTGEIETEGLGMMAHDMGYECWGMPNLEIRHVNL
ncbi:MAG: hypothetical protein ACKV2V_10000 [Blastocatellia bacterium]